MSLLFETIRIENGIIQHPEEHEKRMLRSRSALFGSAETVCLQEVIRVPDEFSSGTVRCRIDYGTNVESVKFSRYAARKLGTFQVVISNEIEYPHKYSDRSAIESLLVKKEDADEIIIVKKGLVTDTSFSNLIFFDGRQWVTPAEPLLRGTCRERLIREGSITPTPISLAQLKSFRGFKIINAMIRPEDLDVIPMEACRMP
jgi:4-amino-4-deoxychorismate lyase